MSVRACVGACRNVLFRAAQHLSVTAKRIILHSSSQTLLCNKKKKTKTKKSSPYLITHKTASPSASRRAHGGRCALLDAERATSGRAGSEKEREREREGEERMQGGAKSTKNPFLVVQLQIFYFFCTFFSPQHPQKQSEKACYICATTLMCCCISSRFFKDMQSSCCRRRRFQLSARM